MPNYSDFEYTAKRINKTSVEWRCRNRNCSSTLSLSLDNSSVLREPCAHNESCTAVQPSKIIVEQVIEIMKRRARAKITSISKIYSEEIVGARMRNPGVLAGFYFPSLTSIDSTLYDHRSQNYPALPKILGDLTLFDEWCVTKHGEQFVLIDTFCKFLSSL